MPNLGTDLALDTSRVNGINVALGQPLSIMSDPVSWHRANSGVTESAGVSAWTSIITRYGVTVLQSDTDLQPTSNASGGLGGQGYLHFDGTERLNTFPSNPTINRSTVSELYMYCVSRFNQVSVDPQVQTMGALEGGAGNSLAGFRDWFGKYRGTVRNDVGTQVDLTDTNTYDLAWHLTELWWDGSTSYLRVDGGPTLSGAVTGNLNYTALQLSYAQGNAPIDVCEGLLSFVDCVANGERDRLVAYLNYQYGTDWS